MSSGTASPSNERLTKSKWQALVEGPVALARSLIEQWFKSEGMPVPRAVVDKCLGYGRTCFSAESHPARKSQQKVIADYALEHLRSCKIRYYKGVVCSFDIDIARVILTYGSDPGTVLEASFSRSELLKHGVFEHGRFHFWTYVNQSHLGYVIEAIPRIQITPAMEKEFDAEVEKLVPNVDEALDGSSDC